MEVKAPCTWRRILSANIIDNFPLRHWQRRSKFVRRHRKPNKRMENKVKKMRRKFEDTNDMKWKKLSQGCQTVITKFLDYFTDQMK
jgi:hypothetical protein